MNAFRTLLAAGTAGAVLALSSTAVQAQTRVRVSLDWLFQGPAAFFLLPQAKGYFKEEGLDVTVDAGNGSAGVLNRVAAGTHDIALADVSAMIEFLAANRGNPNAQLVGVLSAYDASPAAVVTLKKSGITKPKDFEGKTLGAPVFDAGRKAFPLFAKATGIDMSKIKWTTMDPPLRETMLVRGEVDAVTGFLFSNWFSLLQRGAKEDEIVAFKYADFGATMYGSFLVASPRFVAEQPEAIRKFNRAFVKGMREVVANPDAAVQFVKARDPIIDVPLETRRLKMAIDISVATPNVKANGVGAVNKLRLEESTAAVVSAFGLKQSPDVDGMFNSSFLPSRSERMIFSK
jgi:NitT/TauT family transport system substrate-binding protein